MINSDLKTEKDLQNTKIQNSTTLNTSSELPPSLINDSSSTMHHYHLSNQQPTSPSILHENSVLANIKNEGIHSKKQEDPVPVLENEKQALGTPQSKPILMSFSQSKNTLSSPLSSAVNTNNLLSNKYVTCKEKPSIRIHVPLKGQANVYVNFAREAEKQYGWATLHPLQAENLIKLGIEKFDHEADSDDGDESESNMDDDGKSKLSITHPENENQHLQEPFIPVQKKRRRRLQEEEYDTLDPFIDDSELFLEKIAASKDGFFVFSGPLIPKGDKVKIERTDESTKKGRGRGGKHINRTINKNTKSKETKSLKENTGKKIKTNQNAKHTHEQSENKEHTQLQKVAEKKETKEPKPNKDLNIEEDLEPIQKNLKEIKDNKDTINTQKSKKSKKTERTENDKNKE